MSMEEHIAELYCKVDELEAEIVLLRLEIIQLKKELAERIGGA